MPIHYVEGKHQCFVQAESPEQALEIAVGQNEVAMWSMPRVFATEWVDNILKPVDLVLLEDQSFWDEDEDE